MVHLPHDDSGRLLVKPAAFQHLGAMFATRNKCIASSNKCLTSSNKKLLETSASLLGKRTLLGAKGHRYYEQEATSSSWAIATRMLGLL